MTEHTDTTDTTDTTGATALNDLAEATEDALESFRASIDSAVDASVAAADAVTRTTDRVGLATGLAARGARHRDRLADADTSIVVSGIRGKSGTTERLHDVFDRRGADVLAKITGDEPYCRRNGELREIQREGRVTLYENVEQLREHGPAEVLIFENQAITDYTTRLFNKRFARPDVVFLTNVRQDHRDTLGGDRSRIARAFARSIPPGTHVVCGEQDPDIRAVLDVELDRRDADVTYVDVPAEHAEIPGAESVYGVDAVLEAAGEPGLSDADRRRFLDEMRVDWTELPSGQVFDAAAVNDVESTEVVRQALAGDDTVQPVVNLRDDRRARTDAFVTYLDDLYDRGLVEQVRAVGDDVDLFDRRTAVPVVTHDVTPAPDDPEIDPKTCEPGPEHEADAERVLDAALADRWPVVFMGNTCTPFMRALDAEVDERASVLADTTDWADEQPSPRTPARAD